MKDEGSGVERGSVAEADRKYLEACLALASLGEGETSPNPMVGAVLVKDGRLLGQGYHRRVGDRHAEMAALEEAGGAASGSTLYVNLEPCVHHGRTPPCVDALIEAGIAEVVACMKDPDPRVDGRGFKRLREAGIRVRHGILEKQASRLNEKFIKFVSTGVPFVTLKAAMTLDGRIAAATGASKWITSEEARDEGQRLRYQHDAILVGVNTVLKDDPLLTARRGGGKPLLRAILDSRLRIPPAAKLLSNADGGRTVLYARKGAPKAEEGRLTRLAGVEVKEVSGSRIGLDWKQILADLAQRQVESILVEGGGKTLGTALSSGVADRIALFIAPRILGGRGVAAFAGMGVENLDAAPRVREWSWRPIGPDLLVEGYLSPPEERPR